MSRPPLINVILMSTSESSHINILTGDIKKITVYINDHNQSIYEILNDFIKIINGCIIRSFEASDNLHRNIRELFIQECKKVNQSFNSNNSSSHSLGSSSNAQNIQQALQNILYTNNPTQHSRYSQQSSAQERLPSSRINRMHNVFRQDNIHQQQQQPRNIFNHPPRSDNVRINHTPLSPESKSHDEISSFVSMMNHLINNTSLFPNIDGLMVDIEQVDLDELNNFQLDNEHNRPTTHPTNSTQNTQPIQRTLSTHSTHSTTRLTPNVPTASSANLSRSLGSNNSTIMSSHTTIPNDNVRRHQEMELKESPQPERFIVNDRDPREIHESQPTNTTETKSDIDEKEVVSPPSHSTELNTRSIKSQEIIKTLAAKIFNTIKIKKVRPPNFNNLTRTGYRKIKNFVHNITRVWLAQAEIDSLLTELNILYNFDEDE